MLKYFIKIYSLDVNKRCMRELFELRSEGMNSLFNAETVILCAFSKSEPYFKTFKGVKRKYDQEMARESNIEDSKRGGYYRTYSIIAYDDESNDIQEYYMPDITKFIINSYEKYKEYLNEKQEEKAN